MWLGAHVGIADGLAEAAVEGRTIGCDCIQIFSKSPQMWAGPPIAAAAAEAFRAAVRTEGLRSTQVHHGYLANLANPKPFLLKRSRKAFLDELDRAELLGVDTLVFHPGAHLGSGVGAGLKVLTGSLHDALEARPNGRVRILLENAAGQGTTLCSKFEELATVLDALDRPDRLGVNLDTCHLYAAGYDFHDATAYGALMDHVEKVLGTRRVFAFHLNDAQEKLGSRLDRHQNIGKGHIGLEGFRSLLNDPRWSNAPGYLETPLDDHGYRRYVEDLETLRSLLSSAPAASPKRRPASRQSAARGSTVK